MTSPADLLDACAQAEQVARGAVTPLELVDAAIARCEKLDPTLNALVSPQFERAREQARSPDLLRGPLRGVPLLLKDLGAHLAGDPVYNGMQILKRRDWREPGETYFAARLRRAGAISLGRTNSPELGLAPTTEPLSHGPTRNPWNADHSPGGSSGGSAAAVAAGLVAAAHASDGGGSIRIPAAHCGLVGLKPTRGRSSFGPDLGDRWAGFSCEGFVTRSVRDTAALLDIVAGAEPGDPYAAAPPARPFRDEVGAEPGRLRVGLLARALRGDTDAECSAAAERSAGLLAELGHDVSESHPPALADEAAGPAFITVVASSTAWALDAWGAKLGQTLGPDDVEPLTWAVAELGRGMTAAQYVAAIATCHDFTRRVAAWWQSGFDLLVTPTCASPPPELGHFDPAPDNPLLGFARSAPFSIFTSPFNVTGQPGISLPLHWSAAGLPVGVQLVAATGREDLLLRVAAQLEAAAPWAGRVPPLHASRI
jgi:amidase